jgi:hypothetical protein
MSLRAVGCTHRSDAMLFRNGIVLAERQGFEPWIGL